MRVKVLILLVLSGLGVQACGDDEKPPGTPVSVGNGNDGGPRAGTGGPFVPIGGSGGDDDDGGQGDDDGGGGTGLSDAGGMGGAGGAGGADMGVRCDDVDPVPAGTDPDPIVLSNVVTAPTDLQITRAEAAWEVGCVEPALRVTLSSGNCPDGDGHELTFLLPADGVAESTLVLGQNVIMEEPAAGSIRVRYTRPGRIDPNGVWGTCAGARGTLDLIGQRLELIQGRVIQGNYILDLTRCDDGEASIQIVEGSFHIEVPRSLDDVCP